MISLKIEKADASLLALLCARSFPERVEPFAESRDEAAKMLAALGRLGLMLEREGFAVR